MGYYKETDVRIGFLLDDARRFPWDLYGGVPVLGMPHQYACRIMAPYASAYEIKAFLSSSPSWREFTSVLSPIAEHDKVVYEIDSFFSKMYDRDPDSISTASKVLSFLRNSHVFKDNFQEYMNSLYYSGGYAFPDDSKPTNESARYDY
jgi:hypothetical protein